MLKLENIIKESDDEMYDKEMILTKYDKDYSTEYD